MRRRRHNDQACVYSTKKAKPNQGLSSKTSVSKAFQLFKRPERADNDVPPPFIAYLQGTLARGVGAEVRFDYNRTFFNKRIDHSIYSCG